jgi:FkbM family methyltransferase
MSQKKSLPFKLDISDELSAWRSKTFYSKEPETLKWLEFFAVINHNYEILIDVGANIGIYTLYWLHFPNTRAIAIEPFDKNIRLLSKNIRMNDFMTRVDIISKPLSSQNTLGWSTINDIRPGGSDYKLSLNNNLNQSNSIKVETLTLDSILDGKKEKYILKIDTDGTDFDILKGAELALKDGRIVSILIESSEEDQGFIESYLKSFDLIADSRFNLIDEHSDTRRKINGKEERNRVYSKNF